MTTVTLSAADLGTLQLFKLDASGDDKTLVLPAAAASYALRKSSRVLFVRTDGSSHTCTVKAASGETLDGVDGGTGGVGLATQFAGVGVATDGTQWFTGTTPPAAPPALDPTSVTGFLSCLDVTRAYTAGGLIWQDLAKTTPATAHADPVAVVTCPFTGTDYAAPNASGWTLYNEGGGEWSLLSSGTSDGRLVVPVALVGSVTVVWRGLLSAAGFYPMFVTTSGGFELRTNTGSGVPEYLVGGGTSAALSLSVVGAVVTLTASASASNAGGLYRAGVQSAAGTSSASVSASAVTVGARPDGSYAMPGRVAKVYLFSAVLGAADRGRMETFAAGGELAAGVDDIEIPDPDRGLILWSPDGNRWRVQVDNTGSLIAAGPL